MAPSNSSNFLVIEDPYYEVSKEVRRDNRDRKVVVVGNHPDSATSADESSGESQGCGPKEE